MRCGVGILRAEAGMTDSKHALQRSRTDRWLAGVCGGIAEWLGWDPTLVRVLYILVSILSVGFPGILVYIALWILMPERS